jgi:nitrite reductase (cytochrome c-552)
MGHANPVSCVDCHDPQSMSIRLTRPAFVEGIQALAESDAPTPHLPSIECWREAPYDPNEDATRTEMRSYVYGQCHVESYCSSDFKLTFPWGQGLTVENTEAFWNDTTLSSGERFYDYKAARRS